MICPSIASAQTICFDNSSLFIRGISFTCSGRFLINTWLSLFSSSVLCIKHSTCKTSKSVLLNFSAFQSMSNPFALPILCGDKNVNFFLGLLTGTILSLNKTVSTKILSNLIASLLYFLRKK